jgi:hypothetical protein
MNTKATWACLLGGLGLVICGLLLSDETSDARGLRVRAPAQGPRRDAGEPLARRATSPTPPALASASFRSLPTAQLRSAAKTPWRSPKRRAPAPPVSLTASDGTGLKLRSLRVRAAVEGPLALTQLKLAFQNPRRETIEGRFEITLPSGATISRFAMRLPGGWQEAEVVERQAARLTYESYVHVRRDPALLEKKAGNTFRARVFPIPALGVKQLLVSYSQRLTGRPGQKPRYRLRLRGLPKLRRLSIDVIVGQTKSRVNTSLGGVQIAAKHVRVEKRHYRPRADFTLPLPASAVGLRHGNLVVARVTPRLAKLAAAPLTGLSVLVDTSASRAVGLPAQVELLRALLRELGRRHGGKLPLHVAAFDQGVEPIYSGQLAGFGRAAADRILLRRGLGASNLQAALRWAATTRNTDRLLLITDGLATAGAAGIAALQQAAKALPRALQRIDVLLVGGSHDRRAMQRLVTATRAHDGVVLEAEQPVAQLAQRLGQATLSGIEVQIAGARWVWPTVLDGVQPGDTTLVFADVPRLPAGAPLAVQLSGRHREQLSIRLRPTPRPLLERASVRAQIARLEQRRDRLANAGTAGLRTGKSDARRAQQVKEQIVALSTRHRVLSDHTAMIVLESEAEYRRFKIARKALADVLAVGSVGVEVIKRRGVDSPALGVLGSIRGSGLGSLFGPQALGRDARDVLSGLLGGRIGSSSGSSGLGLARAGGGGGGRARGEIGIGTLGTIGKGGGGGAGAGYGRGAQRATARHRRAAARMGTLALLRGAPRGAGIHGAVHAPPQPAARRPRASGLPRLRRQALIGVGRAQVRGGLDRQVIARVIRRHLNEVKYCYQRELQSRPALTGRVIVQFTITSRGTVGAARTSVSTLGNKRVERCISLAVGRWRFPRPRGPSLVVVNHPFVLRPARLGRRGWVGPSITMPSRLARQRLRKVPSAIELLRRGEAKSKLRALGELLARGKTRQALAGALRWQAKDPTHVLALTGLGQTLEAAGLPTLAARAYGSLIDLYPSRAAMRRFAAERLEALGGQAAVLALDSYQQAAAQRPDHLSGHRLLAWAQLRAGQPAAAVSTLVGALGRSYPRWRNRNDWKRVLRGDLGLIAAAWLRQSPRRRVELLRRLRAVGATLATKPSLRFALSWETDANDVDLHLQDAMGHRASSKGRSTIRGMQRHGDVTNGFGPEVLAIRGKPRAYPYQLAVRYTSRGPMGYGFGTVQIIEHDGAGTLRFDHRPFVALERGERIELGKVFGLDQARPKGGH